MRIENERLKRALEVSLEQEWRTMPEESEIWKMHRFSPGFFEKMQRLQEEAQETEQKKETSGKKSFGKRRFMRGLATAACVTLVLLGIGTTLVNQFKGSTDIAKNEMAENAGMADEKLADTAQQNPTSAAGVENDEEVAAGDSGVEWMSVAQIFEVTDKVIMRNIGHGDGATAEISMEGAALEKLQTILEKQEVTEVAEFESTEEQNDAWELHTDTQTMKVHAYGVVVTAADGAQHLYKMKEDGQTFLEELEAFYQEQE